MPSTYSPDLRIQIIANGEKTGTWGIITNENLGVVIEDAISGLATVPILSTKQPLTIQDGVYDEARNAAVRVTTALSTAFEVYIPPVTKQYTFINDTNQVATVYAWDSNFPSHIVPIGDGIVVPAFKSTLLRCDGTDVFEQLNHVTGNLSVGGNFTAAGTVTFNTEPAGDSSTKAATTAFVTGAINSAEALLGTMSTQDADAVAITGGTISGGTMSGMTSIADTAGNVRALPINAKTASYVLLATDAGKVITITTGGVTLNTGIFAVGDTVSIYNNGAAAQTITQGASVTIKTTLSNLTGNRTLAAYGLCTLLCIATNTFVITGAGVT